MSKEFRKLNDEGIRLFAEYLADGAIGATPVHLLTDPSTSDTLPAAAYPAQKEFSDRFEFGVYLNELLKGLDPVQISRDRGLWTALALYWFDNICPPGKNGERKVDREYRYILSGHYNTYYRHLVRSPWQCVRDHGENARFMLIRPRDVDHPLAIHGEILEQIGGRQRLFGSKAIVRAANAMYLDAKTGRPRKGVSGNREGSALRFGKVVRQFDLTFDPDTMSVEEFIDILPKEFSKWKKAMNSSGAEKNSSQSDVHILQKSAVSGAGA